MRIKYPFLLPIFILVFGCSQSTTSTAVLPDPDTVITERVKVADVKWTLGLQSVTGNKDEIDGISTDIQGNTFIGSLFSNTVALVDGQPGAEITTITAGKGSDAFVIKLNSHGVILWKRTFDSGANDYLWDLTTDQTGDVIISGGYSGELMINGTPYSARRDGSAYYAKLDGKTGEFLWFRTFGADLSGENEPIDAAKLAGGNEIKVGPKNNIIATLSGHTDNYQIGSQTFPSNGYMDSFIIKLSPIGEVIWVYQFKGEGRKQLRAVGVNGLGEVAFGHQVIGPMEDEDGKVIVDSRSEAQGVAGLLTSDGKLKWILPVTSEGFTNVRGTGGVADGSVYFTGTILGKGHIGNKAVAAQPDGSTFLAKYSESGHLQWIRLLGNDKGGTAGELVAQGNLVAITSTNAGDTYNLYDANGNILKKNLYNISSRYNYARLTIFNASGEVVATHAPTFSDGSVVGVLEFAGPNCLVWQFSFYGRLRYANGDYYIAPDTRNEGFLNKDATVAKICWE